MRRKHMLAVRVLIAVLLGSAVSVAAQDEATANDAESDEALATTASAADQPTTPPDTTSAEVDPFFAAAIEASGVLTSPSAEEIALASDTSLYPPDNGSTQVSAADHFVSLRTCHPTAGSTLEPTIASRPCTTGWSYVTGSVDGGEVHRGLLGDADTPEVYVLDDRFFVAVETSSGVQREPTAWLIDSVSGRHAELTWRDEPTTVSAREQALVVSDGPMSVPRVTHVAESVDSCCWGELFLPRVVDARDGTIRPLAVPEDASANLPVIQTGRGRIWIGTAPDGNDLGEEELDVVQVAGLAFSDDGGGATWTEVTLPAQLFAAERLEAEDSWGASIAADGDSIAVTSAWSYADDRYVYVSSDTGRSWLTVTFANPEMNNGAFLYVLADKRLLLVRSDDVVPDHLFVSTGSDWTELEENLQATRATRNKYVSVNRDGTVLMYFPVSMYDDGNIGNSPDAPPSGNISVPT
jgi:hypothetical protein